MSDNELSDSNGSAFDKLRNACCKLMGEAEFNEIDGIFRIHPEDLDALEETLRALPPQNK